MDGIGFAVRGGEIYGIAGVGGQRAAGAGGRVDGGLRRPARGSIAIDGAELAGRDVPAFRRRGMRAVPADRFRTGLLAELAVYENHGVTGVPAGEYGNPALVRRGRHENGGGAGDRGLQHPRRGARHPPARLLSGGNAQKLLLARELRGGGQRAGRPLAYPRSRRKRLPHDPRPAAGRGGRGPPPAC